MYQLQFEIRKPSEWRTPEKIDEATHATISIRHGPYVTEVVMELPDDKMGRTMVLHRRGQIERMLELAYEEGDRAARAEIRRALGVTGVR